MPETVFGLPLHTLVVHAAVVLVPVSALLAIVIAVSQDRRQRWGTLTWLLATTALAAVVVAPVTEELIFRGFLHRGWERSRLGVSGTIILTSVLVSTAPGIDA